MLKPAVPLKEKKKSNNSTWVTWKRLMRSKDSEHQHYEYIVKDRTGVQVARREQERTQAKKLKARKYLKAR